MCKSKWTKKEDDLLRNNYSGHTVKELAEILPNRTMKAISARVAHLGLKKQVITRGWSEGQDDYLHENYLKMSDKEMSKVLEKTENAVASRRRKYRLYRAEGIGVGRKDGRSKLTTKQRVRVLMSAAKLVDQCEGKTFPCNCKCCEQAKRISSVFDAPDEAHIRYEEIKEEFGWIE